MSFTEGELKWIRRHTEKSLKELNNMKPTSPILKSSILKWLYNIMETGIITISDNKKDFIKEKVNDSVQMRCLMFQSLSSICYCSRLFSSFVLPLQAPIAPPRKQTSIFTLGKSLKK